MNSRRKIINVTKKEGFEDMYDVYYVINKDKRGNNNCFFGVESIIYNDGIITFNPNARTNLNGLQLLSHLLRSTQNEIITEIKKYLNK